MTRVPLATLLALLAACPADDLDGSTGTTAAASSTGPADAPAGCDCVDDRGALTCARELCPPISVECRAPADVFAPECPRDWHIDTAALACALAAVRDGQQGTLRWQLARNSGFSGHGGWLHLLPDHRALRHQHWWFDDYAEAGATELRLLDPNDLAACLDLPADDDRFACLLAGTLGDLLSECAPGFVVADP